MSNGNPWGIRFMAMFHKANDSHLFHSAPDEGLLALFEAKMIHQFDHRWATYDGAESRDVMFAEKQNVAFSARPRYWVDAREVELRLGERDWKRGWLMGWRDITNATN